MTHDLEACQTGRCCHDTVATAADTMHIKREVPQQVVNLFPAQEVP